MGVVVDNAVSSDVVIPGKRLLCSVHTEGL